VSHGHSPTRPSVPRWLRRAPALPASARPCTRLPNCGFARLLLFRGTSIEPFVSSNLIQIVATVTKLGWTTSDEHKQIVTEVSKFLHATTGHLVLGLQLLQQCAPCHRPARAAC